MERTTNCGAEAEGEPQGKRLKPATEALPDFSLEDAPVAGLVMMYYEVEYAVVFLDVFTFAEFL